VNGGENRISQLLRLNAFADKGKWPESCEDSQVITSNSETTAPSKCPHKSLQDIWTVLHWAMERKMVNVY
jgi:hypothetical protein